MRWSLPAQCPRIKDCRLFCATDVIETCCSVQTWYRVSGGNSAAGAAQECQLKLHAASMRPNRLVIRMTCCLQHEIELVRSGCRGLGCGSSRGRAQRSVGGVAGHFQDRSLWTS